MTCCEGSLEDMGTVEKPAHSSDLSLSSSRPWHHQTGVFLSQIWARILPTTEASVQLWSVSSVCVHRVCGFAFGGGVPRVMWCKMAALCQEKVRQRLVTLGKIRQEKKSEKACKIESKESKYSETEIEWTFKKYYFDLVPQSTNRGLCLTINQRQRRHNGAKAELFHGCKQANIFTVITVQCQTSRSCK